MLEQLFPLTKRALLDGKNSSPASSLERPRSPIDLDDTSNDGSNSVTSPKSLSDRGSSASAFRQVWYFSVDFDTRPAKFDSTLGRRLVEQGLKSHDTQLSPEIFDPRKVDPKFLEANFEYFILSTARDDENK